jgi:hypothetical protein
MEWAISCVNNTSRTSRETNFVEIPPPLRFPLLPYSHCLAKESHASCSSTFCSHHQEQAHRSSHEQAKILVDAEKENGLRANHRPYNGKQHNVSRYWSCQKAQYANSENGGRAWQTKRRHAWITMSSHPGNERIYQE